MKPSPRTATFGIAAAAWIALTAYYIASGFEPDFWLGSITYANYGYYPYILVRKFSAISAVEIATLLLIVRPWNSRGLRGRMLVAFILFLLWTMGWIAAAMHQPPVQGAHLLWLIALVPILLVALIGVSAITWIRDRRTRLPDHSPSDDAPVAAAMSTNQPQNACASSVDYYVEADIDEEFLLECLSEHLATRVASAEYPSPSARYHLMHLTHCEGFRCHVCLCWRKDETTLDEPAVALHLAVSLRTRVMFELPCKTLPDSHGWLLVDQQGTKFSTEIEEGEDGIWPAAGTTIPLPSQLQPPTSFPKHL